VIHRTFRSLDDAPKLVGFTVRQWVALIGGTAIVLAIVHVAELPSKAAITLLVFTIGLPAALTYVSESGGLQLGVLMCDVWRWRVRRKSLPEAARPTFGARGNRGAASLLGVAAITPDGLAITADGSYVRYLETGAVNPLVMDATEGERVSGAFAQIAARLPDSEAMQLYVQAVPLKLEELLADEAHRCEQAVGAARDVGQDARAGAIRGLGDAQEQTIRASARTVAPLRLRYLVVCPWAPARGALSLRRSGHGRKRIDEAAHEHSARDSMRHADGIRADLETMGLATRPLTGDEVLDLLHSRFDPDTHDAGGVPASFLHPDATARPTPPGSDEEAEGRANVLAQAICTAPVDLTQHGQIGVGHSIEQVLHVSLPPEQTWLGWLLHMTQAPCPFTLTVHVQATERYRERMAQKRRYKRLFGVNRGVEQRGRPLDPDARRAEEEAAQLTDELTTSAGAGIYRLSIYLALREPTGDAETLAEHAGAIAREVTMASDARIQHGPFAQERLWESTLPLGRDPARRRRKYVARNVGDSFPLVGTSCGSPDGIPLGYALPGRTLERLDPFDPAHPNHLLLINGMSGAGKTMAAIILLARALSHGAGGFIIDRAGHFEFLVSLIPGASSVEIGAEGHAINSWDVENAACVPAEKVDYLLALHALLLGEHQSARDSYGLSDLESNLLGLAIGEVYERCALTGEEPRELLLQEELERRYHRERSEGSVGIAEALRNLSMRLNNYLREGPYGYLTDRPTTIPPGAPLIVFDTRLIPDAKAAAALFVICEHVKSRIARTRREHLAGKGPAHSWAGRSFLVIDEAWKLIERPATGRWFNEFCRRSRHQALWLIAISQQLSDFDNEHGKALLANAAMRLFLRQEARELTYVKESLALTDEAIDAISQLKTVRGRYSTAYLMNGTRGEGTVQIPAGPTEYWIASSDPARDETIRQQALRDAAGNSWRALELLADEQWQLATAELTEAVA
jgi:DNA helicase HerA-like ATPase